MSNIVKQEKRDTSIELFRIVTMLCIVAHHYIVNSGILNEITQGNVLEKNSLISLLFGWGGKTGINCFVLITGYFMCQSSINIKKILKLLLEVEFYRIVIQFIFIITGYAQYSFSELMQEIIPIYDIGTGFTSSYLIFMLFIPYLNLLLKVMDKKKHMMLIILCLFVDTLLPTFFKTHKSLNYVVWFMVLYFIAAYIRLYPQEIFAKRKLWTSMMAVSLGMSWFSVINGALAYSETGINSYYFYVADSNKFLAVFTAVCAFMFFKNLRLKYYPVINKVAASTYGVLLIHANSDTMRRWLWKDILQNVNAFHSNYFIIHAICSVIIVYVICTLIDFIRIDLLERPFFKLYDKRFGQEQ